MRRPFGGRHGAATEGAAGSHRPFRSEWQELSQWQSAQASQSGLFRPSANQIRIWWGRGLAASLRAGERRGRAVRRAGQGAARRVCRTRLRHRHHEPGPQVGTNTALSLLAPLGACSAVWVPQGHAAPVREAVAGPGSSPAFSRSHLIPSAGRGRIRIRPVFLPEERRVRCVWPWEVRFWVV